MGAIHFSIDETLLAFLTRHLPLKIFVETGTFQGDSLRVARKFFPECHSVEMSQHYYEASLNGFAGQPDVHLYLGDSPEYLRKQQAHFTGVPVLFWLDAHWCAAENTASQSSQSPLLAELRAIGTLHAQSVILIDDARLYLCPPPAPHRFSDWPDFHSIVQALLRLSQRHRLLVCNDVFIFYPTEIQTALTQHAHEHGADWLAIACDARAFQERKRRKRWWGLGRCKAA